jgi:HK97 family phage prohead protease
MPLPKPKDNESEQEFIERCMSDDTMKEEYGDNDKRLAVCYSQWRKEKESNSMKNFERRYFTADEFRYDEKEGIITGYAARFNVWSEDLGFFKEKIRAGAFSKTIGESDVRCLFNHNPDLVLGRSKNGTLELSEDNKGLVYSCKLPDTTYARDLQVSIERGDVTQNSFGFTTVKDEWNERGDKRELVEVRLFDVSPVTYPAYPQTDVKVRSALIDIGINYDALVSVIMRSKGGFVVTESDRECLESTIDILSRYLPAEPDAEVHSDSVEEPDESTLLRLREIEIECKKII